MKYRSFFVSFDVSFLWDAVVAQEVLQVQGLSQASGLDQLLRSSRQRNLLQTCVYLYDLLQY
jgi:hypothetical protein